MTIRRPKTHHQTVIWLALGATACLLPSACGGDSACDGPGGLCLTPPGSNGGMNAGGTKADGGSGGSSAGRGGSRNAGGTNGSGGSTNGGEGGSPDNGGSAGSTNGGSSSKGGSAPFGGFGGSGAGRGGTTGAGGSAAAGGIIVTGGAPNGFCPEESAFVSTCDAPPGEGGAGGDKGGWCEAAVGQAGQGGDPGLPSGGEAGMAGVAGTVGMAGESGIGGEGFGGAGSGSGGFGGKATGGLPGTGDPVNPTFFPIDDFEDGDEVTLPIFGGRGVWFTSHDPSGEQYPSPCALPSPMMGLASVYAMRTFGRDFTTLGGGWAQVGTSLRSGAPECNGSIDASQATGVRFWARGTGALRFMVTTAATEPIEQGGSCATGCYDSHGVVLMLTPSWHQYFYPFVYMNQEGWGTQVPFDPSQVRGLVWAARDPANLANSVACFDFMLDNVAFYKE